jgi:hypothetical protein
VEKRLAVASPRFSAAEAELVGHEPAFEYAKAKRSYSADQHRVNTTHFVDT